MNAATLTPGKVIAIGIAGLAIVSFLAFHWLTDPVLSESDISEFSGAVTEAWETRGNRKGLEISLENHPYPFRSYSSSYPHAFDKTALNRLGVGAYVTVGIPSTEVESPRKNWIKNQKFYKMVTLKIGGMEALSVSAYNDSVESNRSFGPWFCLAMGILSLFLIFYGFRCHKTGKPIIDETTPKRKSGEQTPEAIGQGR